MNKKLAAIAISAICSTSALAGNAVLNVEGQIQVNGTTVIGADGKVSPQALPNSNGTASIELAKYDKVLGQYTYEFRDVRYEYDFDSGEEIVREYVCTEIEKLESYYNGSYEEICTLDGVEVERYSGTWIDNQNGTDTYSWTYFNGIEDVTNTETVAFEYAVTYPEFVALGSKQLEASTRTILETDSEWESVGDSYTGANTLTVLSTTPSHSGYDNCIIYEGGGYWNGVLEGDVMVRCEGVGNVSSLSYSNGYELIGFTPFASSRSAVGEQTARSAKDLIKNKIRKNKS